MSSSLLLSNDDLARCSELKEKGFPQNISVGKQLGRGFADLGHEQFLLLPAGKLLSLFTGDIVLLDSIDQSHLYTVPSVEDMHSYLYECACTFEPIHCDSSYKWTVVSHCAGQSFTGKDKSLWNAYAQVCEAFLSSSCSESLHA